MRHTLAFAASDAVSSAPLQTTLPATLQATLQAQIDQQVRRRTAELERKLTESNERNAYLLNLHSEKNDWLQMLVHDLKNPLSGILLAASFLERYWKRMSLTEFLRNTSSIRANADRMDTIITRVLSIGAIESGMLDLALDHINLAKLLIVAVTEYNDRAKEKAITIELEAESEDLYVYADRCALLEIVDNLLSNAIKYSPFNTSIHLHLRTIRNEQEQEIVQMEFRDQGPGIKADELDKLFTKFARLSAKPTGGEHSSGLGLAMVQKLTHAMQGSVRCESEYGCGAVFTVEFTRSTPEQYLDVQTLDMQTLDVPTPHAQTPHAQTPHAQTPIAINGFDTVGYFLLNKPTQGNPDIYADWEGKRWLFEREYHRELFLNDPARFIPKYHGYCALGMRNNYSAAGNPESWNISNNELFLFYDEKTLQEWETKLEEYIAEADVNWSAGSFSEYAEQ